ncbi:hypothetical protein GGR41_000501 [Paenalcaligenes hominis]|uniref:Uncharacterized protein n=1 Tax=Paenalcaligenes hominis TaxID=643674 RepID=A0ABX0WNF0_9BURK|nr:hypothetical protein [Paenalcaligenes hominis]NJB64280.1 hypothetical protein [Paenalcaligenes hominis]
MTNSTKKGFKMVNYNLAASNGIQLDSTLSTGLAANRMQGIWHRVVTVAKRIDRKAQLFFEAQATTRGRKAKQVKWGFELHAGF